MINNIKLQKIIEEVASRCEGKYLFLQDKSKIDIKAIIERIILNNPEKINSSIYKKIKEEIEDEVLLQIKEKNFNFFIDYINYLKRKEENLENVYTKFYYFLKNEFIKSTPQEILGEIIYNCSEVKEDLKYLCIPLGNDYSEKNLEEKIENPITRACLHMYLSQEELLEEDEEKSKYYLGLTKKELFERLENDDKELLSQFMYANRSLVYKIASKYQASNISIEDLVQEGNIGFMIGLKKYNYRLGFAFSTYVTNWIHQAITRYIANNSRTIRVPIHNIERYTKYIKTQNKLVVKLERNPTDEEMAEELEMSLKQYRHYKSIMESITRMDNSISIDQSITTDKDLYLHEVIPSMEKPVQEQITDNSLRESLEKALDMLKPKEKIILELRYGLNGEAPKTLEEVSEQFSVTRERIRQIEQKALIKILNSKTGENLLDYLDNPKNGKLYMNEIRKLKGKGITGKKIQKIRDEIDGTKEETKVIRNTMAPQRKMQRRKGENGMKQAQTLKEFFTEEELKYFDIVLDSLTELDKERLHMRYGENLLGDEVIKCPKEINSYVVCNVITKMRKRMALCISQVKEGKEINLPISRSKKISKEEEILSDKKESNIIEENKTKELVQIPEIIQKEETKEKNNDDEFTKFMKKIDDNTWKYFHQLIGTRNFLLLSLKYERYTNHLDDKTLCEIFNITEEEFNKNIVTSLRLIKAYLVNTKEEKEHLINELDKKVFSKK